MGIYKVKYENVSNSARDDYIISAKHEKFYVTAENSDEAENLFKKYITKEINLGQIISIEEITLPQGKQEQ